MKISQLFSLYTQFKMGENPLREVTGLSFDSQKIQPGEVFVAIRGERADGHKYLPSVVQNDVAGVVVEDESLIPPSFRGAILVVPNTRVALSRLAARFYGNPAEKLFCVAVTGTSGKTSTTYLIEHILNSFGLKTGVIGTVNHHIGDQIWPSELTTPDPVTLQKRLREFLAMGGKALAMEVSSHALDQGRVEGIAFDAAVFTNLSREHLDYHKTIENYFASKEKLFRELPMLHPEKKMVAILNASDPWATQVQMAHNVHAVRFGESKSDFQFQIHEMGFGQTKFRLQTSRGAIEIEMPLAGRHNVYNAVAALAVGVAAGASLETCAAALKTFRGIPGRLEPVPNERNRFVFVDYAHKPEALREVLQLLNHVRERGALKSQIITVFGCGGDRDRGKRPLMGEIAAQLSDRVVLTSDNPRTEDPSSIIQEIESGVPLADRGSKVTVELDRRKAIRQAIELSAPNDVILIAGKGHENYQILGDKKVDFDDVLVAREILNHLS